MLGEALLAAVRLRGHPRYRLRIAGKVAGLYVRMRWERHLRWKPDGTGPH